MITTFIPTYRRPQDLKKAIESVLNQTEKHFQIIVLDNASGDETEAIVRSYPQVRYHCHNENIGMLGNYAYAFSHIDTPFFHILSDDDTISPWFYETALQDLHDFPDIAFAACAIEAIDEQGIVVGDSLKNWPHEGYYKAPLGALEMTKAHSRFPMPTGVVFRQECVKHIQPALTKEMLLMWDPDYLTQIAARYPIAMSKKKCGTFLAHTNSYSSKYYKKLHETAEDFEELVIPCKNMITRIHQAAHISRATQLAIEKNMIRYVRSLAKALSIRYIRNKKYTDVKKISVIIKNSIGLDLYQKTLLKLSGIAKDYTTFQNILDSALKNAVSLYRALIPK